MPFNPGDRVVYLGGGGDHLNHTEGFANVWIPQMDELEVGGVFTVNRAGVGGMSLRDAPGELNWWVWPPQVFRLEGEAEPEPVVDRFLIFNSVTNRFYAFQGGDTDSVTYDQGIRIMRQALNIDHNRVLHLIPLRSITKVSSRGTEDYRV